MFQNKNVLVIGLAKSGVSAVKALKDNGAIVTITDMKTAEELSDVLNEIALFIDDLILGGMPETVEKYDCIVMSPGVPISIPLVEAANIRGIKVIGEIELAYLLSKGTYIGITGTNGKTTTTALVGEVFKLADTDSYVVGNIGTAAVSVATQTNEKTVLITELSSFQLETIDTFRPHIAAILNISPDHLNRHKTMRAYIDAKNRIYENQNEDDFLVLNYDNEITRNLGEKTKAKVYYFSRLRQLNEGFYVENGHFVSNINGEKSVFCSIDDLFVIGDHNIENALAAIGICMLYGIEKEIINLGLKSFKGVEHRIEYVDSFKDRTFYNDSKATNPESATCAIKAMIKPTVLIAGGMDKGSDFDDLIHAFDGKIRAVILLGETKKMIEKTAKAHGFDAVFCVEDMEEAVDRAFEISEIDDAILLSPACASWDMYANFEVRGEHFKTCVKALGVRWR